MPLDPKTLSALAVSLHAVTGSAVLLKLAVPPMLGQRALLGYRGSCHRCCQGQGERGYCGERGAIHPVDPPVND